MGTGKCEACGAAGARVHLGDELLCDRCVDERVSAMTGMPRLPDPPPDEILSGPDGRSHRFRFRLWRAPTGVVMEAAEAGTRDNDGFQFKVMGAHDVDVGALSEKLRQRMRARLSQVHLDPHPHGRGWIAAGDEISGRLEYNDEGESGKPYDVIIDGRRLRWSGFGRALEPFEGWDFTLSIEDTDFVDPSRDAGSLADPLAWPEREAPMAFDDQNDASYPEDLDDEEFLEAWDKAEADAVDLLREALAQLVDEDPPHGALEAAADRIRAGMNERASPYDHMWRAAGFEVRGLAKSNLELWVGAAGGLISMREESGLDAEAEASIMALEHADWLGGIVGLVRAGVGASAEPEALVKYIDECPEVEGEVDPDEAFLVEGAFELVVPAWEAAGAVDSDRRLTSLGRWGLPRALAWAWNGDFDYAAPE